MFSLGNYGHRDVMLFSQDIYSKHETSSYK